MLVVISGEGNTDVGTLDGSHFLPGPMALFVDQWVAGKMQYSLLETGMFHFVPESELIKRCKQMKPVTRRGKKAPSETKYYYKNARALAVIAMQVGHEKDAPVMAVLFKDSDGTRSVGRGEWYHKRQSMLNGFATEAFEFGVPMIPKPTSEAWILCALRQHYVHCHKLEMESGSPKSPDPLKKQLEDFLDVNVSRELLVEKILEGLLDMERIDMPSMQAFKVRCDEVLEKLMPGQSR